MSDGDLPSIIALLGLLLFSAFFSGSETALIGSKRERLTALAEKGNKSAAKALELLEDPGSLLSTILIGNNLVNVAAAAIAASLIGPAWATVIMTLVLLMVGEIPPKTFAAMWPEKISSMIAYPVDFFKKLFWPLIKIATAFANMLLLPFRGEAEPIQHFSREEIATALDFSQDGGELEPGETRMAQEVLELPKVKVCEIMIPAASAAILQTDWLFDQVQTVIRRTHFSRYPVFRPNNDRPVGILHIKDLIIKQEEEGWRFLLRSLPFVDVDEEADDLLRDMQIKRFHMAAVWNKEKKIVGYVTMERILEEIVGEIADEHDKEVDPVNFDEDSGIYQIRKDLELGDLEQILNIDFDSDDPDETISEYYIRETGGISTSALIKSFGVIRPSPTGYIVEIFVKDEDDTKDTKQESIA